MFQAIFILKFIWWILRYLALPLGCTAFVIWSFFSPYMSRIVSTILVGITAIHFYLVDGFEFSDSFDYFFGSGFWFGILWIIGAVISIGALVYICGGPDTAHDQRYETVGKIDLSKKTVTFSEEAVSLSTLGGTIILTIVVCLASLLFNWFWFITIVLCIINIISFIVFFVQKVDDEMVSILFGAIIATFSCIANGISWVINKLKRTKK